MSRKKILVVDDERDMRIFVSTVVETLGFEPIPAENGAKALDLAGGLVPARSKACDPFSAGMGSKPNVSTTVETKIRISRSSSTTRIFLLLISRFHQSLMFCEGLILQASGLVG